jgi:hypothetical protein
MIPRTEEVLAQLVLLWTIRNEEEPVEPITMGKLAGELMYPPLFLINALDKGKQLGVFEHDYETDELRLVGEFESVYMGGEVTSLMGAILVKVGQLNGKEEDVSLGLLQSWCMGVRPSAAELALRRLTLDKSLAEYDLVDPKDEKSVYTFYTLYKNRGEQWGKKQFKEFIERADDE